MLKKCRLLWREARRSQNVQSTSAPEHFWKLRCWRSARDCGVKHIWHIWKRTCSKHCGFGAFLSVEMFKSVRCCSAKHTSKSKVLKSDSFGPLLEVRSSKNCTPFWREAHFEVLKTEGPGRFFEVRMRFCVAGVMDSAPCQKWVKRVGFAACSKPMAGVGQLKMICKDGFRVAGAVQETFSSEMLRGQGADTTLHYATLHCAAVHYTTLHYVHYAYSYNYN